jgi:folate-dependent phosphoribosylglycinamide formyltransferase PurN
MPFNRIVLLAGEWDTTPIVYDFLQENLPVQKVIIEQPVPRITFLKNRIRKLGWMEVGGQVLFQLLISKPLARASKKRISEILQAYRLSTKPIPSNNIVCVSSVNDNESLLQLQQLKPDLVIVHGTRIIAKKILQAVDAPFINIHAGITPRYRGSHGAYWALANNDTDHCGVTVHLVDAGIDTGNILAQAIIPYTQKDNFITYPYLQLAEGLKLLMGVIKKIERGENQKVETNLDSALWHHPTLWGYLWRRITKGVK